LINLVHWQTQDNSGIKPLFDVLALDSIGFGYSEKPPLSYNQYIWRDQVLDLLGKYAKNRSIVLMGNSIGGFTAANVAASLSNDPSRCINVAGLVLFNSAGRILTPEELNRNESVILDNSKQFPMYRGPAPELLRIIGKAIFSLLQPRITSLCRWLYPVKPDIVETNRLSQNIYRDSEDPNAPGVIAAGGIY
jgi:pimeloyl-ACP methyl ester carboxylesterase